MTQKRSRPHFGNWRCTRKIFFKTWFPRRWFSDEIFFTISLTISTTHSQFSLGCKLQSNRPRGRACSRTGCEPSPRVHPIAPKKPSHIKTVGPGVGSTMMVTTSYTPTCFATSSLPGDRCCCSCFSLFLLVAAAAAAA